MSLSKLALISVVTIDVAGQGLVFPIIVTLLTDPKAGLVAPGTPAATSQLFYRIAVGSFFFAWFLGSVYVTHLLDAIGRKTGMLICLGGALAGYALTIASLATATFWLLVAGRVLTGLTADNQPIAQAAMSDLSRDEAERARSMGLIVIGLSLGLVAGPVATGVFPDPALIGATASYGLPFWIAMAAVAASMAMVGLFYRDERLERPPLRIRAGDIFVLLWPRGAMAAIIRRTA